MAAGIAAITTAGLLVGPPSAAAAPACAADQPAAVHVASIPGSAEAAAVDQHGRMFVTDLLNQRLWRIDQPGAPATLLATGFNSMGGIVVRPDGSLLVGTGNDPLTAAQGELGFPAGRIWAVDPDTGAKSVFAKVISPDGLAQGPDGMVYASSLFTGAISKVKPNGQVVAQVWTRLPTANGLAVDATNTNLFVAHSVADRAVTRVPLANPAAAQHLAPVTGLDLIAIPDGLTLDSSDTPIVATHTGQVWRANADGSLCSLADGLLLSSNVAYGHGDQGFAAGHLYRIGFDGAIYEIPAGFDPGAA